jgi:hypothetical protein
MCRLSQDERAVLDEADQLLGEAVDREAHDVEVAALDARHKRPRRPLDAVRASLPEWFPCSTGVAAAGHLPSMYVHLQGAN